MLYPSIQQITQGKINRYTLVIATAKSARHVTQKANEEREISDIRREFEKTVTADSVNDKAVSVAIDKIYHGDYTIMQNKE